ncbi:MAG: (d)CMP kinase [Clostridia bacterium]|nr:(d)CMP kinase [Clostridia bacterium]
MEKTYRIAIDGPSGAGKSTISRQVAAELGILYVDTGAIYRAVGLFMLRAGVDPSVAEAVAPKLSSVSVRLAYDGRGQRIFLGDEDVSDLIRTPDASRAASQVSAHPVVREFLLEMQRDIARHSSCIMDGRDIGTVVLPDAELKIFLTADAEDRARRRCLELSERGTPQAFDDVLRDMIERDERDKNRPVAPLRQADDAVLLDTTGNELEDSIAAVLKIVREKFAEL